jgi:uncharacterized Zn finger protein (UPF0148 family)
MDAAMSDTDDTGFDKEAERERLREKYESEEADRAQTQQMSELLLQGATMTNRHCGECGNPIFRYEGRSFCSVCEEERPADAEDQAGQGTESGVSGDQAEEPTAATEAEFAMEGRHPSAGEDPGQTGPRASSGEGNARLDRPTPETAGPDAVPEPQRASQPTEDGDIAAARASLVRTLSRMAREAEATEEVGRARDYLAAAREAAEALEAVERVRKR